MEKDNCEGFCPVCHSDDVDYEGIELFDGMVYFPYVCKNCGTPGEEWYDLEFTGHMIDKTEVKYLNLNEKRKEKGVKICDSKKGQEYEGENI